MKRPDPLARSSRRRAEEAAEAPGGLSQPLPPTRYGRYVGLLGVLAVVLITINTALTKPNGATGIPPGERLAPFALPLITGSLKGDANVATHLDQGSAGKVPACQVRGGQILNICQLYEQGPVMLALFVDGGSCPAVLGEMQALVSSFPEVRFAAVAIKGERPSLRRLVRAKGLTFPAGIDEDGALAALYKVASCPQISFAYPGGIVQSKALLRNVPLATLRARVSALVSDSRARGWKPAGG
jgi:AhpC/TSA family